jgi:hypothetical protein
MSLFINFCDLYIIMKTPESNTFSAQGWIYFQVSRILPSFALPGMLIEELLPRFVLFFRIRLRLSGNILTQRLIYSNVTLPFCPDQAQDTGLYVPRSKMEHNNTENYSNRNHAAISLS